MAYITKGIELQYQINTTTGAGSFHASLESAYTGDTLKGMHKGEGNEPIKYVIYEDLQEIGEVVMSASGSSGYDQIEVTTLADAKHVYVDGLEADSETGSELSLKFLYNADLFDHFNAMKDDQAEANRADWFYVKLPAGGFNIQAKVASIALDSMAVNAAMTMTLNLSVKDITYGTMEDHSSK